MRRGGRGTSTPAADVCGSSSIPSTHEAAAARQVKLAQAAQTSWVEQRAPAHRHLRAAGCSPSKSRPQSPRISLSSTAGPWATKSPHAAHAGGGGGQLCSFSEQLVASISAPTAAHSPESRQSKKNSCFFLKNDLREEKREGRGAEAGGRGGGGTCQGRRKRRRRRCCKGCGGH